MKKTILFAVLLVNVLFVAAQSDEKEVESIKKVIQTAYVEGLQNEGDLQKIDSGIHPQFKLLGIKDDGTIWALPIDEWKQKIEEKKKQGTLPRSKDNLISIKFLSVDVTGTAAVAKFEFYVGGTLKYVDYISLYKFGNDWKLVSKVFYQFPA